MSSIAQELDATLESLEPSTAAKLTSLVREAMRQVRGSGVATHPPLSPQSWEKRLVSRSAQVATGKQGASLQQVMDDLRD
ncbi:hypothetical protein [Prosthecobacter sp.]|uniref:hypothetical protein n=1 Tax=Prosthecobacter sp. TaxID=1965333 RepID=UPI0037846572